MSNLVLYLDGPLQGWGYMADHAYRNTLPYPTRSGVTGILAAAMGISRRDNDDRLTALHAIAMTTMGLQVEGKSQAGRQIRDYHTAQTRNKRGDAVGNATVTHRDYLVDSQFLVLLEGPDQLLDEIDAALRDPVWFGTLGRRSCVPASPILLGRFDSEESALADLEKKLGCKITIGLRWDEASGSGAILLRDLPMSFASRTYGQRMVKVSSLPHAHGGDVPVSVA